MDNNQSLYEITNKEHEIKYSPVVTIITPVLNCVKYLEACIESVLTQSYPNIEHVFIDGASTDGTVDVLSNYGARYPGKVRYISEPDNGGVEAVNKGILMAKGEILGFIGSDDIYEPGAIEAVVDFFRVNPDAYFVFGGCNLINERGEIVKRVRPRDFNLKYALNVRYDVPGTSTFYKRELIEQIGLYDASGAGLACDIDLLIRAAKVYQIHRIDKVLSSWRFHEWSFTGSSWTIYKMTARSFYIISRRYGGSFFSGHGRRYYMLLTIDWLRPILGYFYPYLAKLLNKRFESRGKGWKLK